MANSEELEKLREEIDEIDNEILDLLNSRGEIVKKVGAVKKNLNLEVFQPQREKEIIDRLKNKAKTLKKSSIEAIWKEIMGACKLIQGSVFKVGYLGPEGTFTHQAALEYFPKANSEFISHRSISEIFENIEKEMTEFGVIPIENSLQGTVRETIDLLIDRDLKIYGEVELRIAQNLIGLESAHLSEIKKIYSHPQAFAQTRSWIKANMPNAKLININSTAEAVKKVKKGNSEEEAAIGTKFSAEVYDLNILAQNIEDNPSNYTRFLIISKKANEIKEGRIKTSIIYVLKHVPGALFQVLKIFADADINLLKIESRPRRTGRWEYIFLMDFEGDAASPKIQAVLDKMNQNVIWYKILGSYPLPQKS